MRSTKTLNIAPLQAACRQISYEACCLRWACIECRAVASARCFTTHAAPLFHAIQVIETMLYAVYKARSGL